MTTNGRFKQAAILIILVSLVYGLVAQGAFYDDNFQIVRWGVYLGAALWMASLFSQDGFTFAHTNLNSKILLLFLALSIATIASLNRKNSITEIQHYIVYFLVYVIIINCVSEKETVNLLCAGLIVAGAILALISLVGLLFRIEPLVMETSGIWRISSTLTYPNALAGYFVLIFPITFYFSSPSQPRWQQLAFGTAFYLILLSLILTFSRSGWLSALLISMSILLTHRRERKNICRFVLLLLSALAAAPFFLKTGPHDYLLPLAATAGISILLILFIYFGSDKNRQEGLQVWQTNALKSRALALAALTLVIGVTIAASYLQLPFVKNLLNRILSEGGYQQRLMSWRGALQIIRQHPILGVGPGNFGQAFNALNYTYATKFAHNEYLQAFAETGIVGLLAFALFFFAVLKEGFQAASRQKEAESKQLAFSLTIGVAGFCLQCLFDFLWHIPAIFMTFFILAALIGTIDRIFPCSH